VHDGNVSQRRLEGASAGSGESSRPRNSAARLNSPIEDASTSVALQRRVLHVYEMLRSFSSLIFWRETIMLIYFSLFASVCIVHTATHT
jgi:hypothetical protein